MILVLGGGRQSREAGVVDRSTRPLYDRAILAKVDVDRGWIEPWVVDAGARRFGALSVDGARIVACTERSVLRIAGDGRICETETHPWLSDVHHALVIDGVAHAASTAVDGVVAMGVDPTFLPTIRGVMPPVVEPDGPSQTHPNFVFRVDGVVHATRGTRGDAVALRDLEKPWAIAPVVVHDGIVTPAGVWFTRVDGHLVLIDPATGRVAQTLALHQPGDGTEPLGWCRGLWIADGIAWVGFSRLRATRLRRHLAWARGRLRGRPIATRRPTRLEGFELATGRRIRSIPLADVGIDALFGVVAEPERRLG